MAEKRTVVKTTVVTTTTEQDGEGSYVRREETITRTGDGVPDISLENLLSGGVATPEELVNLVLPTVTQQYKSDHDGELLRRADDETNDAPTSHIKWPLNSEGTDGVVITTMPQLRHPEGQLPKVNDSVNEEAKERIRWPKNEESTPKEEATFDKMFDLVEDKMKWFQGDHSKPSSSTTSPTIIRNENITHLTRAVDLDGTNVSHIKWPPNIEGADGTEIKRLPPMQHHTDGELPKIQDSVSEEGKSHIKWPKNEESASEDNPLERMFDKVDDFAREKMKWFKSEKTVEEPSVSKKDFQTEFDIHMVDGQLVKAAESTDDSIQSNIKWPPNLEGRDGIEVKPMVMKRHPDGKLPKMADCVTEDEKERIKWPKNEESQHVESIMDKVKDRVDGFADKLHWFKDGKSEVTTVKDTYSETIQQIPESNLPKELEATDETNISHFNWPANTECSDGVEIRRIPKMYHPDGELPKMVESVTEDEKKRIKWPKNEESRHTESVMDKVLDRVDGFADKLKWFKEEKYNVEEAARRISNESPAEQVMQTNLSKELVSTNETNKTNIKWPANIEGTGGVEIRSITKIDHPHGELAKMVDTVTEADKERIKWPKNEESKEKESVMDKALDRIDDFTDKLTWSKEEKTDVTKNARITVNEQTAQPRETNFPRTPESTDEINKSRIKWPANVEGTDGVVISEIPKMHHPDGELQKLLESVTEAEKERIKWPKNEESREKESIMENVLDRENGFADKLTWFRGEKTDVTEKVRITEQTTQPMETNFPKTPESTDETNISRIKWPANMEGTDCVVISRIPKMNHLDGELQKLVECVTEAEKERIKWPKNEECRERESVMDKILDHIDGFTDKLTWTKEEKSEVVETTYRIHNEQTAQSMETNLPKTPESTVGANKSRIKWPANTEGADGIEIRRIPKMYHPEGELPKIIDSVTEAEKERIKWPKNEESRQTDSVMDKILDRMDDFSDKLTWSKEGKYNVEETACRSTNEPTAQLMKETNLPKTLEITDETNKAHIKWPANMEGADGVEIRRIPKMDHPNGELPKIFDSVAEAEKGRIKWPENKESRQTESVMDNVLDRVDGLTDKLKWFKEDTSDKEQAVCSISNELSAQISEANLPKEPEITDEANISHIKWPDNIESTDGVEIRRIPRGDYPNGELPKIPENTNEKEKERIKWPVKTESVHDEDGVLEKMFDRVDDFAKDKMKWLQTEKTPSKTTSPEQLNEFQADLGETALPRIAESTDDANTSRIKWPPNIEGKEGIENRSMPLVHHPQGELQKIHDSLDEEGKERIKWPTDKESVQKEVGRRRSLVKTFDKVDDFAKEKLKWLKGSKGSVDEPKKTEVKLTRTKETVLENERHKIRWPKNEESASTSTQVLPTETHLPRTMETLDDANISHIKWPTDQESQDKTVRVQHSFLKHTDGNLPRISDEVDESKKDRIRWPINEEPASRLSNVGRSSASPVKSNYVYSTSSSETGNLPRTADQMDEDKKHRIRWPIHEEAKPGSPAVESPIENLQRALDSTDETKEGINWPKKQTSSPGVVKVQYTYTTTSEESLQKQPDQLDDVYKDQIKWPKNEEYKPEVLLDSSTKLLTTQAFLPQVLDEVDDHNKSRIKWPKNEESNANIPAVHVKQVLTSQTTAVASEEKLSKSLETTSEEAKKKIKWPKYQQYEGYDIFTEVYTAPLTKNDGNADVHESMKGKVKKWPANTESRDGGMRAPAETPSMLFRTDDQLTEHELYFHPGVEHLSPDGKPGSRVHSARFRRQIGFYKVENIAKSIRIAAVKPNPRRQSWAEAIAQRKDHQHRRQYSAAPSEGREVESRKVGKPIGASIRQPFRTTTTKGPREIAAQGRRPTSKGKRRNDDDNDDGQEHYGFLSNTHDR